jgi:hypothetical protein
MARQCPSHWTTSACVWCGRRDSNAHLRGGSPESYQLDDASTNNRPLQLSKIMATVAGVEPAGRGFGDRTSTTASRPKLGVNDGARTRYRVFHRHAAHPFAFIHHTELGAPCRCLPDLTAVQRRFALRSTGRTQGRVRLELTTSRIPTECSTRRTAGPHAGGPDRPRTGNLSLTRRAHIHSCSGPDYVRRATSPEEPAAAVHARQRREPSADAHGSSPRNRTAAPNLVGGTSGI